MRLLTNFATNDQLLVKIKILTEESAFLKRLFNLQEINKDAYKGILNNTIVRIKFLTMQL